MLDRAAFAVVGAVALCSVAALGVAAADFALYAFAAPALGPAGAAALVAGVAAAVFAVLALALALRRRRREQAAEEARASLLGLIPEDLGAIARERPLVALLISLVSGAAAARHPGLARDLVSLLAAWTRTRP
jgi:hypothetical protein